MPDSKRTSLDEIRSLGRAELNKVAEEEGLFGNAPRSVLMSFETEDGQRYDVTASEVSELLNPAPGASIIWPNIFTTDAAGRIIQRPLGLSIREFIRLFLAEIRKRICKNKTLGHATTGALAALAIWLAERFGIDSHAASAIAAAILVALSSAAKGAFCKMTEAQAQAALGEPKRPPTKRKRT